MKYVDWVQLVVDAYASNPGGSTEMVSVDDVARRLGIPVDDPREGAVANALDDLRYISALAFTEWHRIKPTAATWQLRDGLRLQSGWSELEFGPLNSDPEAVLATAVRLSRDRHDDWADMRVTTAAEVVADLGWDGDAFDLLLITEDLQAAGLERTAMGGGHAYIRIRPRYAGVVRASERVQSEWDLRLRDMVSEWEITTVEFKSQVVLGTPRRNAEFARTSMPWPTPSQAASSGIWSSDTTP